MILPASYSNGFAPRDGQPLYPELWRGCVGAWNPGLGPSGLSLRDWSGFGNHGTLTNGPTWAGSSGKYAINFDGVDDYVSVPAKFNRLRVEDSKTISLWVNPTVINTRIIAFALVLDDSQSAGNAIDIEISSSTILVRGWGNANIAAKTISTVNIWYHVGVSQVGTTYNLYVDGQFITSGTSVQAGEIGLCRIGSFNAGFPTPFWAGKIDDLRLYNRSCSANEIRILATRRGIAYELAPRRRSSSAVQFNRRRRLLLGAQS